MNNMAGEIYPSPIATAELVGRKEELDAIRKAVEDAPHRYVIYITGQGGIGKTRLVQHVLQTLSREKGSSLSVASMPVDMYHTINHTVEGFTRTLQEVLAPGGNGFEHYLEERKRLHKIAREEIARWQEQRERMINAFIDDLNHLAEKRRVVFALDTIEKLFPEEDPVAGRLGIRVTSPFIYEWLLKKFFPRLQNAVIILAGRPVPFASLEEDLRETGQFVSIQLRGLSEEESLGYFKALERSLRERGSPRDIFVAERIEQWNDDDRRKIFHCLRDEDGTVRPILLALAIDYLAITGKSFPAIEGKTLPEAKALSEGEREQIRNELLESIQAAIREASALTSDLILTLAWLTKGADINLLARLVGRSPKHKKMKEACRQLRDFSFVKIRPMDDRFFLHDEMYRLLRDPRGAIPDVIFQPLEEYYKERIRQLRDDISRLYVEAAPKLPDWEELAESVAVVQDAIIEDLHYKLRRNAVAGFVAYSLYSDEAIAAVDSVLDMQLQTELMGFLAERDPDREAEEIDGLRRADVLADAAVRWVRRLIAQGSHKKAREVAERLRKEAADLLEGGGELARADLDVSEAVALIYLGKSHKAEELLNRAEKILSELKVPEGQEPRVDAIRARLHNNLGYLRRVQGQHIAAAKEYQIAIPLWRKLKMEAEHANTLTNQAYVLAQHGHFEAARRLMRDALALRQRLGFRGPLALTLNALARIELFAGEYLKAEQYATRALRIAEQVQFRRGIGLAHITLASCYRFMSEPPLAQKERRQLLQKALEHSDKALKIFSEEVEEPERLGEAYYVRGITHREFCRKPLLPGVNVEEHSRQAEEDLEKAKEIARENGFWEHYFDVAMGQAWLYYYLNEEEKLQAHLQKIEDEIRSRFPAYLITEKRLPEVQDDTLLGIFTQIARMHVLKGVQAMDAFERSEKKPPYEELKTAAREFTIAMEYDHLIAEDFRDLRRAMNVIYERLKGLNAREMKAFYESVKETAQEFGWEPCHFLEKLEDHFGPYEIISEFGV